MACTDCANEILPTLESQNFSEQFQSHKIMVCFYVCNSCLEGVVDNVVRGIFNCNKMPIMALDKYFGTTFLGYLYVQYCVQVFSGYCRMRVKKLPHVLALHLKRFKLEQPNRSIKLSYRVVFPLELRLFNTVVTIYHFLFFAEWSMIIYCSSHIYSWMFCIHLSMFILDLSLVYTFCGKLFDFNDHAN